MSDHDPVFLGLLQALLGEEGYEALVPPKLDELSPSITQLRLDAVVMDLSLIHI